MKISSHKFGTDLCHFRGIFQKTRNPNSLRIRVLTFCHFCFAEREGFEPPVVLPTSVFKTGALNRSAISPRRDKIRKKFISHNISRQKMVHLYIADFQGPTQKLQYNNHINRILRMAFTISQTYSLQLFMEG